MVIAIIGVLVALLLPAVQSAREAARRLQCTNHLKQMGLALHSYHSAHRSFPAGVVPYDSAPYARASWGWAVLILPFLEQDALHAGLGVGRKKLYEAYNDDPDGFTAAVQSSLSVYRCPSDPAPDLNDAGNRTLAGTGQLAATSNYVGNHCWRHPHEQPSPRGVLVYGGAVRIESITDGTSNTFAIGERAWLGGEGGGSGAAIWVGAANQNGSFPIYSTLARSMQGPNAVGFSYNYSSEHPGGANFGFADGSVHFLPDTINSNFTGWGGDNPRDANCGVFQRLSLRNDRLPVSIPQ